jgi:nitroimidazol reductase NimA-like FMN-containing flavoprotein (pyridoxamine 5'-phosphate oxidase superfamily)
VTLLDGIVLARSAFHHSVNYRSAVILGTIRTLADSGEKHEALRTIVEHVARGRSEDARGPSEQELAATEVLALAIREASAKARSGPPVDTAEDYALPVWAGELPLRMVAGEPVPDERCNAPEPAYLRSWGHAYA